MWKSMIVTIVVASTFSMTGIAFAKEQGGAPSSTDTDAIYRLMKERGYRCLECHDVDRRVVGPPWKEVAAKRHAYKWAQELIANKISVGSVGEYGTRPMPHNEVTDEDADLIANWILSLWQYAPKVAGSTPCPER
jgi:cytochrome c551/c552